MIEKTQNPCEHFTEILLNRYDRLKKNPQHKLWHDHPMLSKKYNDTLFIVKM
ncbi:MAG: hypothetical protein LBF88_06960 [Planctomycetaceae bacterium]|nr:hypothetical protein [Planctomycetaceae bacterium]